MDRNVSETSFFTFRVKKIVSFPELGILCRCNSVYLWVEVNNILLVVNCNTKTHSQEGDKNPGSRLNKRQYFVVYIALKLPVNRAVA